MPLVYCQNYEESERGWGTRPDGHSFHLSREDAGQFAQDYCQLGTLPQAPDEYSRPIGELAHVEVDAKTFKELERARADGKLGIWGDPASWLR